MTIQSNVIVDMFKVICSNPMIIGAASVIKGNASHYRVQVASKAGNESNVYMLPIHKTLTMHDQPEFLKTISAYTDSRFTSIDTYLRYWPPAGFGGVTKWYSKG